MNKYMHIVQVAAEFAPIAKAGGLGEVLVGLSRELIKAGQDVKIILPKYRFIHEKQLQELRREIPNFFVSEKNRQIANTMWMAESENCPLRLLEAKHPDNYFGREKIYGFEDDLARFLYFSRAVLEYLKIQNKPIDVLHLHDWHVAALAPLIKELYAQQIDVRLIALSVHNVEYQGKCTAQDLEPIGLTNQYIKKLQSDDSKHPNQYNLLKGAIELSDLIIPVSPSYAKEILTPTYGFGLDSSLKRNEKKIQGILNGIDLHLWDPSTDARLFSNYHSSNKPSTIRAAKQTNKKQIANRFGISSRKEPWIGAITRLVPQKGPELLEEALKQTISLGGVFVLLGSSPIPSMQKHFETLKERYTNHKQALLHLNYDEDLAHQLYSALDFLLVPSYFEPCGLTQMIAMRYGTIPIVRSTGGLKDTVFDLESPFSPPSQQNGFVFHEPSSNALNQTLRRVFHLWQNNPSVIEDIMLRGMQTDFGWTVPAQKYLQSFQAIEASKTN